MYDTATYCPTLIHNGFAVREIIFQDFNDKTQTVKKIIFVLKLLLINWMLTLNRESLMDAT